MLSEGADAPDFTLTGSDGKEHRLSDFRGRNVVLYFYPQRRHAGLHDRGEGVQQIA